MALNILGTPNKIEVKSAQLDEVIATPQQAQAVAAAMSQPDGWEDREKKADGKA